MQAAFSRTVCCALVLLGLVVPAAAAARPQANKKRQVGIQFKEEAQAPKTGNRKALVIGNAAYPGSALANTTRDARDVANALEELGFTVHAHVDLDLKAFRKNTGAFVDDIQKGDTVFIFYAGHGMEIDGVNYLVPTDFGAQRASDVAYEAYALNQLLDGVQQQNPAVTVVVLDACRNNPFLANRSFGKRGLAQVNAGEGALIAYATSPGKTASDGAAQGNGVFTGSLVKHLRTPGVDIEGVFKDVSDEVAIKTNREQIPWRSSSIVGKVYLASPPQDGTPPPVASAPAPAAPRPATPAPSPWDDEDPPAKAAAQAQPAGKANVCWVDGVHGAWVSGMSHLMAFVMDGQPHVLAYSSATGAVVVGRLDQEGASLETIWQGTWSMGWQRLVPLVRKKGRPQFILYNPVNGLAQYEEFNAKAQDSTTRKTVSWRAGFSAILPLAYDGDPTFLGYSQGTGQMAAWRVDAAFNDPNIWEGTGPVGFDHVASTTFKGVPLVVGYSTGSQEILVAPWHDGNGLKVPDVRPGPEGVDWLGATALGQDMLQVVYDWDTGFTAVVRTTRQDVISVGQEAWEPKLTFISLMPHKGRVYAFRYAAETGQLHVTVTCR